MKYTDIHELIITLTNNTFQYADKYVNDYALTILNKMNPEYSGFFYKSEIFRCNPDGNNKILGINKLPDDITVQVNEFFFKFLAIKTDKEWFKFYLKKAIGTKTDVYDVWSSLPKQIRTGNTFPENLDMRYKAMHEKAIALYTKYQSMKLIYS